MQLKHTHTHTQKIYAVDGEGAVTDQMCQNWFVRFHAGDFLLDDAPLSGRPIEANSNQIEIFRTMLYHVGDNWHTQNIQIDKIIGEYDISVYYFMEKTKWTFGQPSI